MNIIFKCYVGTKLVEVEEKSKVLSLKADTCNGWTNITYSSKKVIGNIFAPGKGTLVIEAK